MKILVKGFSWQESIKINKSSDYNLQNITSKFNKLNGSRGQIRTADFHHVKVTL